MKELQIAGHEMDIQDRIGMARGCHHSRDESEDSVEAVVNLLFSHLSATFMVSDANVNSSI